MIQIVRLSLRQCTTCNNVETRNLKMSLDSNLCLLSRVTIRHTHSKEEHNLVNTAGTYHPAHTLNTGKVLVSVRNQLMYRLCTTLLTRTALPVYSLVRLSLAYHTSSTFTQLSKHRRRNSRRRIPADHVIMPKAPKSKKKGNKFYAVRVGRTPGVYQSWDECEMQVYRQLEQPGRQLMIR